MWLVGTISKECGADVTAERCCIGVPGHVVSLLIHSYCVLKGFLYGFKLSHADSVWPQKSETSNPEQGFLCQQNRGILGVVFPLCFYRNVSCHIDLERSAALTMFLFPQRLVPSPSSVRLSLPLPMCLQWLFHSFLPKKLS